MKLPMALGEGRYPIVSIAWRTHRFDAAEIDQATNTLNGVPLEHLTTYTMACEPDGVWHALLAFTICYRVTMANGRTTRDFDFTMPAIGTLPEELLCLLTNAVKLSPCSELWASRTGDFTVRGLIVNGPR